MISNTMNRNATAIGGLSHLVEAATALTKLDVGRQASPITTIEPPKSNLIVSDDDEESKRLAKRPPSPSRDIFPQRLMQILEESYSDVISWLPHGRSFVIIRPDVFSERVLPQFFPSTDSRSSTKYPSFTRKLNRWGFRQATRGPDTGAFHHPLFRRDQPQLCLDMVCQKSRKRGATSKGGKGKVDSSSPSQAPATKPQEGRIKSCPLTKESLATLPTSEPHHECKTVSLTSADESSVSLGLAAAPTAMLKTTNQVPNTALLSPWVPSDPTLVAKALRDRDEKEKLIVAKSMLYEAYLNALRG